MKKIIMMLLGGVFILTTSMLSAAWSNSSDEELSKSADNEKIMYIQGAAEATVKPDPRNPGYFILTMKGVRPHVAYFADRKERMTGKISMENFLIDWKKGYNKFKSSNPNAALVTKLSGSKGIEYAEENQIVLSNPKYNPRTRTLTYRIKDISSDETLKAGRFNEPILFIDNNCFIFCE